ncbi:hypothetical protein CUS_7640 [Ruminococcus albus 8]|uniref:Uncharacterized protein n=1 Tax=Ruminococcus albus 8 TaxID=246199 RepID=E9SHB3_RUMAL|nr:hypothetical protein CUS_7640 [Ruminococcus albus 8]
MSFKLIFSASLSVYPFVFGDLPPRTRQHACVKVSFIFITVITPIHRTEKPSVCSHLFPAAGRVKKTSL